MIWLVIFLRCELLQMRQLCGVRRCEILQMRQLFVRDGVKYLKLVSCLCEMV